VLQKLNETLDGGTVLKKGIFKTIDFSYIRNREQCFMASSEWPALVVKEILSRGGLQSRADAVQDRSLPNTYPDNLVFLRCQLRMLYRFIKTKFNNVFMLTQWTIGVVDKPISAFLEPDIDKDFSKDTHWLKGHGKDCFYADPFPLSYGGNTYIFFEELNYKEGKGFIASVQYDGASFTDYKQLLKLPQHISYPYPVLYQNDYYFIPEICESGSVHMYKAVDFPEGWQHEEIMLPGTAGVDCSLVEYEEKWWMFGTDDQDGSSYKLKIWYADDLKGPWRAHRANPVKIDIRSSRPAGKPFIHEGMLYRPAQNYSEKNQGSISINRICKLTTEEFSEEYVTEVYPFKGSLYHDAIHTINGIGDKTVIDSRRKFFALGSLAGSLYACQIIRDKINQLMGRGFG